MEKIAGEVSLMTCSSWSAGSKQTKFIFINSTPTTIAVRNGGAEIATAPLEKSEDTP